MIICGIKITHDGGISLIDNGKLIFSIEMEKVNNNSRYSELNDLSVVEELIQSKGYRLEDIDLFAVDGWHADQSKSESSLTVSSGGREIEIKVAGYNEKELKDNNLSPMKYSEGLVLGDKSYPYHSYRHVVGHILGTYCTSPFSQKKENSYVLVWDGGQYPRLYFIDAEKKEITNKGPLFFLMGTIYGIMGHYFGPYKKTEEELAEEREKMELDGYFGGLSVAGKIMAYIAYGEVKQDLLQVLPQLYDSVFEISNLLEHKFCKEISDYVKDKDYSDADVLLTIHHFIQNKLIESLEKKIEKDNLPATNLCFCGGSALNIKWNSAIRSSGIFKEMYVPPFPNDSGSAIGTACAAMWDQTDLHTVDWNVYCGPGIIENDMVEEGWQKEECTLAQLAQLIHEKKEPVVFLNKNAEAGPRALGNRSLLAVATDLSIKKCLNEVKGRENFRPVAPICLLERASEMFDPGCDDPFMLFEHEVREEWLDKIPAICHLDGSARLQTVAQDSHSVEIRTLLEEYEKLSGIPLLCNTSANLNGKGFFPDVKSACQWGKLNYVWCGNVLYSKLDKQPLAVENEEEEVMYL
ncbi:carbamoyltransferase N-terminal domain-containing protein [Chryseobacterium indologenes]|nr:MULTISPECIES: carbamoyltransferase N-terminal domain-containing protein [Chryseobacterium]MDM1553020.1 hypothetical protein [Chryseobacterium indologenes]WET49146.1 carbamoyltransferase N-terminal domain-containing protein [Chryseobacterium indologenes]